MSASGTGTFLDLVDDELGLRFDPEDLDLNFDQLEDWDSVQLLRLVGVLEREAGRTLPVPKLIEARCLREIYELVGDA